MQAALNDPIRSIRTSYQGIELRSRMEAQCAVLFDRMGWKWHYEPFSMMLPNGIGYTPDFWIEDEDLIVECRGYQTDHGDRQLHCFAARVEEGLILPNRRACTRFIIIGPRRVATFKQGSIVQWRDVFHQCGCGWKAPGLERCRCAACVDLGMPLCHNCHAVPHRRFRLSAERGKLLLDGHPLDCRCCPPIGDEDCVGDTLFPACY